MVIFGILGYLMRKYKYDTPPLVLAFVLGPIMEASLRRSLLLSNGSPLIFFERPISVGLLLVTFVLLASSNIPALKRKREKIVVEVDD